jgi:tetratricopeptide (TPR) repeat protein
MAAKSDAITATRLNSWKEIAAYLGRADRTVKRWESERGLPIHRAPGGRGAVFAYSDELTEWLESTDDGDRPIPGGRGAQVPAVVVKVTPAGNLPVSDADVNGSHRDASVPKAVWFLLLALAIAVGALFLPSLRHSTRQHASNAESQDLYLKGRYYWERRTPEDLTKAVDYFTQAIVENPANAPAYVGLADCYNLLREFGVMAPSEAYPRAIAAAQRALALDDKSAEAHNSLAFATFWWSWHGATAKREFEQALRLNPNLVRAHHWYATYLMARHQFPAALDQIQEAQRLDPSSSAILADKGFLLWKAGQGDAALTLLRQLEASDPSLSSIHYYLGKIDWEEGDYPNAIDEWRKESKLKHDDAGVALADAQASGFAANKLQGLFERELPLQKVAVDHGGGSAYDLAVTCASLGQKKEALSYLQIAFNRREAGMLTGDPQIPSLQSDPEYQKLRSQVDNLMAQ